MSCDHLSVVVVVVREVIVVVLKVVAVKFAVVMGMAAVEEVLVQKKMIAFVEIYQHIG